MAKKKRKRSLIVKDLDRVFSLYIRYTRSKNGICKCVTCGREYEIAKIQCGHFQSRRHYSTRWDEHNVDTQCYTCNVGNQGEQYKFAKAINQRHGDGYAEQIEQRSRETVKFTDHELNQLIDYYRQQLWNHCRKHGIEYPKIPKPK